MEKQAAKFQTGQEKSPLGFAPSPHYHHLGDRAANTHVWNDMLKLYPNCGRKGGPRGAGITVALRNGHMHSRRAPKGQDPHHLPWVTSHCPGSMRPSMGGNSD